MTDEVKTGRGGARPGAGRKKSEYDYEAVTKEFILPALGQAFNADPGKFKDRYLSVELSKTDIKLAYGAKGLALWSDYFVQEKVGGIDRNGVGYKTRWSLPLGRFTLVKALIEMFGHSIKDIPNPGFPPTAMLERLQKIEANRAKLKAKREAKALKNLVK